MKCKKCGNDISKDINYCSKCGTIINHQNNESNKIENYHITIITIFFIIVALMFLVRFTYTNDPLYWSIRFIISLMVITEIGLIVYEKIEHPEDSAIKFSFTLLVSIFVFIICYVYFSVIINCIGNLKVII